MCRTLRIGFLLFVDLIKKQKPIKEIMKLEKEGKIAERDEKINFWEFDWAQWFTNLTDTKVEVTGIENIPKDKPVVYIANHQGMMDIPVLSGYIPYPKAYIAKMELRKVPMLGNWLDQMKSVFISRNNPKQSMKAILQGIENVKNGYSMVIFPEGTRSRGGPMKAFKPGSFKLAFKSGADIIPVTINGTYKVYEEKKKFVPNNTVRLTVHPAVPTAGLSKEEQRKIPQQVEDTVRSALDPVEVKEN